MPPAAVHAHTGKASCATAHPLTHPCCISCLPTCKHHLLSTCLHTQLPVWWDAASSQPHLRQQPHRLNRHCPSPSRVSTQNSTYPAALYPHCPGQLPPSPSSVCTHTQPIQSHSTHLVSPSSSPSPPPSSVCTHTQPMQPHYTTAGLIPLTLSLTFKRLHAHPANPPTHHLHI